MKRITIWIDTENEKFDRDYEKIKRLLHSVGNRYRILDVMDVKISSDSK